MTITLGYWNIRGLAQALRLIMEYTGDKYEEVRYDFDPKEFSCKKWFVEDKNNLGLDFPNLPYYLDGDVKITQSNAILRYIGEKHDLAGKGSNRAVVGMMEQEVHDLRSGFVKLCYGGDYETAKVAYLSSLPSKLEAFSKSLGSKKWLCGAEITYPDFNFYDILDQLRIFSPDCLKSFANLQKYMDTFEAFPRIAAYKKSKRYIQRPLNNVMAHFK